MNDVFVSFPFEERFDAVFQAIRDVVSKHGLNPIRIDQASHVAEPIASEIQRRIRESRLVIADITGNNPNVHNEIGLAQALGKPLVLISQDRPSTASFNVRGLHILTYDIENLTRLRQLVERA